MTKKALVIVGPGAVGLTLAADGKNENALFFFGRNYQKKKLKWNGFLSDHFENQLSECTVFPLIELFNFNILKEFDEIKIFYCLPPQEPMPKWEIPKCISNKGVLEIWFLQNGYLDNRYIERFGGEKVYRGLIRFGCQRQVSASEDNITLLGGRSISFGLLNTKKDQTLKAPWTDSLFHWEYLDNIRTYEAIKLFINLILLLESGGLPITNESILKKIQNNGNLKIFSSIFVQHLPILIKITSCQLEESFEELATVTKDTINSFSLSWAKGYKDPALALFMQTKNLIHEGFDRILRCSSFPNVMK